MSKDEQALHLGHALLELREKEQEKRCLSSKADKIAKGLADILRLHEEGNYGEEMQHYLSSVKNQTITETFTALVRVTDEINGLKKTLDL